MGEGCSHGKPLLGGDGARPPPGGQNPSPPRRCLGDPRLGAPFQVHDPRHHRRRHRPCSVPPRPLRAARCDEPALPVCHRVSRARPSRVCRPPLFHRQILSPRSCWNRHCGLSHRSPCQVCPSRTRPFHRLQRTTCFFSRRIYHGLDHCLCSYHSHLGCLPQITHHHCSK